MTSSAKAKGDRAERELAAILADHLGVTVRRKLGAGRKDDEGDLEGLVCTAEVKSYRDVTAAIRDGLDDLAREQANAGNALGVCFVRRPGGRWIAVMDIPGFCAWYREATA